MFRVISWKECGLLERAGVYLVFFLKNSVVYYKCGGWGVWKVWVFCLIFD